MNHTLESFKQQAAEQALTYVQSGMRLGLGSGTTARYVVEGLAARLRDGRLHTIVGVPTSDATAALARSLGVPLATLDEQPLLDIDIDGADEISPQLDLVKGLGGALLREKIVAAAASQFIVIGDSRKQVTTLGTHAPLPVEVIGFGLRPAERHLRALGCEPALRLTASGPPFITDEGNYILDCRFTSISKPAELSNAIRAISGVVDHGLFIGMATRAIIAGENGLIEIERGAV